MNRLSIYTWHDGNPTCDQVLSIPANLTTDEALGLALLKLQCDPTAIQVEIEFEDSGIADVSQFRRAA